MSGEDMQEVKVLVPSERVADFYAMVAKWLVEPPEEDPAMVIEPWAADDLDRAETVWRKMSKSARALFSLLMENPGARISGEQIAQDLNIANGRSGVAGVLAWPGRYSYKVGRKFPIKWESGDYWMTPEIADLFKQARDQVEAS